MAKKRVTRKQLLNEPDEFITTTGKIITWAKQNTRPLLIGVAAFFALVIGISVYGYVNQKRADTAQMLFSEAVTKYQAEAEKSNEADALAAVRKDFDQLFEIHGGQPAGRLGRIFYGHISLAGKDYDQAIAHYRKALDDFGGDASLTNIIYNGLASAYQQKGELPLAVENFRKIADGADRLLKDAALFNLGRLYGQMDKTEESKKAYEQLSADFPGSMFANMAREKVPG